MHLVAPNGGSINRQGGHLEMGPAAAGIPVALEFAVGKARGRYTLEVTQGNETRTFEFWVGTEAPTAARALIAGSPGNARKASNMKIIATIILLPILFLAVPVFAQGDEDYDLSCGNDGDNDPPPDCPCKEQSEVGTNPINATKANHHRDVTDIATFGAAPISFTRSVNSRNFRF